MRPTDPTTFEEDIKFRGLHPMIARRLQMWRLTNFEISPPPRRPARCTCSTASPATTRPTSGSIAVAEVRDVTPVRDDDGQRASPCPRSSTCSSAVSTRIRRARAGAPRRRRASSGTGSCSTSGRSSTCRSTSSTTIARRLAPLTEGLGLEQVVVSGRLAVPGADEPVEAVMRLGLRDRAAASRCASPSRPTEPMQPLDDYTRKLIQTRRRGLVYPYELVPLLRGDGGTFVEHDLDDDGRARAGRPSGRASNRAGRRRRCRHARRPSATPRASPASPCSATRPRRWARSPRPSAGGCSRPIDLAARARRADRVVRPVGRRQDRHGLGQREPRLGGARAAPAGRAHPAGGEVNVVVAGINVGAQPYWNAEATMLMHTRGILVMTPDSAMVLTGKQAIDYSGGVSAEDNLGIGGYERIMGPNGEAQYWAPDAGRGVRRPVRPLRPDVPCAGRALAASGRRRRTRSTATCAPTPHRRRRHRLHDRRRHLLRRRPTPTARSRSTSAR